MRGRMEEGRRKRPMSLKIFTFNFTNSGNSCDVWVDLEKAHRPGFQSCLEIQWDRFPPSRKDQKRWGKKCFPQVLQQIEKLLSKRVGTIALNAAGELVVTDGS